MTARITFIGHATTLIELDGLRLLTDPVLRDRVGPLVRSGPLIEVAWTRAIDAVLISHLHHDHLDLPSLRRLGDVLVIVPDGAGRYLAQNGIRRVAELTAGRSLGQGRLRIEATRARHSGLRAPFGPLAACAGYLIHGSERVYFAGDTGLFAGMGSLSSGLDVALLPVWGWGPSLGPEHLDPYRAAVALQLLRPRVAIPIHWGTLHLPLLPRLRPGFLTQPPYAFRREARVLAPAVEVRVLTPGQSLTLDG